MGKRKTVTTVVEDEKQDETAGEIDLLSAGDDEPGLAEEIDAIDELKSLGADDGVKWTVKKIARKPGESGGYCATYSSGELSLDGIRETFGGGKYQIRGNDAAGKYVAMRTIEIVELPKSPQHPQERVSAVGQNAGELAQLITAMKPAGDGNILPLIMKMIEAQGTMFTAIMNRPPPASDKSSLTDILALIKATKDDGGGKSAVDMLLKGLDLGKSLGGGGTDMMDIAAKGLDMIGPLIARSAAPPSAAAAPRPSAQYLPPPAEVKSPLQPPASPVAPAGVDPVLQKLHWLTRQVQVLCHHAARDSDPELYAAVLLDNLPDFITEAELHTRLSAPDAVQQLAQLDGRVTTYAAWFEEFRKAVLEQLTPDEDEAPDGDSSIGDTES